MNGAHFDPVLKASYERMIAAGKPPKVALIALARKRLTILNAMLRDRRDWQQAATSHHCRSRLFVSHREEAQHSASQETRLPHTGGMLPWNLVNGALQT